MKTEIKWMQLPQTPCTHKHLSVASAASPPTVCKPSLPMIHCFALQHAALKADMSQQSVRMNISPGQRGFSSLWLACKCWIWHLHLSVISSGYQFQISSLFWHLCTSILPCVYVYLEHLAVLSCAIVSQNARFDGSEIFLLWFSTQFVMAFRTASHFSSPFMHFICIEYND